MRARHPCTPVPELRFTLANGLSVEAGSRSMTEADARRAAESIAGQGWDLFCAKAGAEACARGGDYRITISLSPGYCIAQVYEKARHRGFGWYRCDPQFRLSVDRW